MRLGAEFIEEDARYPTRAWMARYRELWEDQRFIVCVFHNNDLNQVTWELLPSR